ncbi:MAG TPA: murein transglycosylase A [Alphaproteobacteria bacterium]|nr:murein transglycosylase A [Alphaproteobacteria bacterium]
MLCLAGCHPSPKAPAPERLTLQPVSFDDLPGWRDDAVAAALPALRRSCAKLAAAPPDAPAGPAGTGLRAQAWQGACAALGSLPGDDETLARAYFERWFHPYRAGNNGMAEGLFTGYYEPELHGALHRYGRYTVPLYGRPQDLVTVELGLFDAGLKGKRIDGRVVDGALRPYPTRAEIEAGALDGKATPLLWVDDPIEAFFLEIQGSGRVVLEDGAVVQVGYAAQNGRNYRSIGKLLVERGAMTLDEVSLQSLKAWLRDHPGQAKELMDENPAYVFFRKLPGETPLGAEGVPLTPGRSLAVDPRFVPYGCPVWLDIENPVSGVGRLRRLVIAQDTGSAIKGPVRGDLFWGTGSRAEEIAGHMRARGAYYLLLPMAPDGAVAASPAASG